jgi:GH15 family glucan-1,4-alpha-glucosidase
VRILEPLQGRPGVRIRFTPATNYGARAAELTAGSHHLRVAATDAACRLTTDASLSAITEQHPFELDRSMALILGPDETIESAPLTVAHAWMEQTATYWEEWVRSLAVPLDWQAAVIRAAITLKLCTYEDSGAVLAALTTSIPESADSGRTWDYRYCWLRDSAFVIQALNRLGATRTMEGFLRFINNIVAQSPAVALQPAYALAGGMRHDEVMIETLDGFRGMGPVRMGNHALTQNQNDVYGAVVMAASQFFYDLRLTLPGDATLFARLESLGEHGFNAYDRPDAGPWEMRGTQQVHTYSACMCWAACDRLARIAGHLGLGERAEHWHARARALRQHILARAWCDHCNSLVSRYDGHDVDATALLLPEMGFMSAADPRFVATMSRIDRELRVGEYLFRYRHDDDFGAPRNAFTVCSFWYVNALGRMGHTSRARDAFEKLLAQRNPLGLLSEDIDPTTHEHWGNYPQTYSMVGIISSALRLSRSWEEVV